MIPDNSLSSQLVKGSFLYPDNLISSGLVDWELGGIALQDTSEGLRYQVWKAHYNAEDSTCYLTAETTAPGVLIPLWTRPNVIEISISFDQNMRWTTTSIDSSLVLEHRWYDSLAQGYVATLYPGIFSAKLCLDDKRPHQLTRGVTDNILSYTKPTGGCFWRLQRDRFQQEYDSEEALPGGLRITNFGMNSVNSLQWRFSIRGRRN